MLATEIFSDSNQLLRANEQYSILLQSYLQHFVLQESFNSLELVITESWQTCTKYFYSKWTSFIEYLKNLAWNIKNEIFNRQIKTWHQMNFLNWNSVLRMIKLKIVRFQKQNLVSQTMKQNSLLVIQLIFHWILD